MPVFGLASSLSQHSVSILHISRTLQTILLNHFLKKRYMHFFIIIIGKNVLVSKY